MKKLSILLFVGALLCIFSAPSLLFAQEKATIIVSGQAHASLYPCICPSAPSGGVSRRATLIDGIRTKDKNVLLLEAGGSFAGGNFDQNSQTSDMDRKRSDIYLSVLAEMGYDVFLVSSEEFNFGQEFFAEMRLKYPLQYLSANLKGDFLPYIIKKVGTLNIAVIGITDARATTKSSLEYVQPSTALANTVKELKKNKDLHCIVVVAYLERDQSVKLIEEVDGIDIWVSSNNPFRPAQTEKIKVTTLVIPAWEARSLTAIAVTQEQGQPVSITVENTVLSGDIRDHKKVHAMIPACFSDSACAKPGFVAQCVKAGTADARCQYSGIKPIAMTVIKPAVCKTCDIETTINKIKQAFPTVEATVIDEHTKQATQLVEKLEIKMLPAYLIDASVESEQTKPILSRMAKKVDAYYMVEPGFSGVSYFMNRKKIANRLDVFFDITTKDMEGLLKVLEELKKRNPALAVQLHFLMIEDPKQGFLAKGGTYEIEEFLRSACIDKYYPEKLWQYLSCRLARIESSWWDDCAIKFDIDPSEIKACAQSPEAKKLLSKFIALTQELEVVFGPTFVINNQEIVSSQGKPTLEELEQLFKEK